MISKVFGAQEDTMLVPVVGEGMLLHIHAIGAGVMTLVLEDSIDGVNYVAVRMTNLADGTSVVGITVAGIYRSQAFGALMRPRLRCSAFTSGTLSGFALTRALQ